MKICYDKISPNYIYTLSKKDIGNIKKIIPSEIVEKIKMIRFGCNTKTTQEGRLVKRGKFYDIRVNFCLNGNKSLILSNDKKYLKDIKAFGGIVNFKLNYIEWKHKDAKRYSLFILFHEIGHIEFCCRYLNGDLSIRNSNREEMWCDNFSKKYIIKMEEKGLL